MGFERLVYTDCLPGESLSGQAGLGFRAASPGADGVVQDTASRQLLYEAPEEWMRRERPVEDYPPMLAHLHRGDWYCTALGAYLGRERKGNRQGNHLTEIICTRDGSDYRGLRPAQLAAADFWLRADPGRTDLDTVADDWDFGDRTADAAFAAVMAAPKWRDRLAVALTVLGDPAFEGRLILVSEDLEEVLNWITTATLLLPRRLAQRIGFKAFTTRPYFGDFAAIAIRPQTAAGLQLSGSAVIDLTGGGDQGPEPGPIEQTWLAQLGLVDHLDLTDAVELADDSGLTPAAAQDLALAVFAGRALSLTHASAVASWLARCPPERHRAYATPAITAVLDLPDRPRPLLLELDRLATSGRPTPGTAAIRLDLIAEELRSAQGGRPIATAPIEPLGRGLWDLDADRAASALLLDMLRTGRSEALDAVLSVADRFALARVDLHQETPDAVERYLAAWEARPSLSPSSSYRYELHEALLRRLDRRCAGDPAALARTAETWFTQLLTWFDPSPLGSPVYRACLAEAGARANDDGLEQGLFQQIRSVRPDDLTAAASALFERRARIRPQLIRRLLDAGPSSPFGPVLMGRLLDPGIVEVGDAVLALENLRITVERGLCDPSSETGRAAAAADPDSGRPLEQADVVALARHAPWILDRITGRVVDAFLDMEGTASAVAALNKCGPDLRADVEEAIRDRLKRSTWTPAQFALGIALYRRKAPPLRRSIASYIRDEAKYLSVAGTEGVIANLGNNSTWRGTLRLVLAEAKNDKALAVLTRGGS
ncbi:GTPase-associated protein 1-related protein [Glycomyces algeriensis]|uniref:Uncharacterized protein n=1 Tax=Glycomyces algeriensis TaxID=256037 RepID=A0A9W6G8C0_9ACTN|nr:GTPase-associated protein 1-related protein [Glycomyces algeriensis]MDA1367924.1 GTPase-associated protein 1-related protein [Glycomyces algeriensis]MDR7349463.1 hypothetical protein [Glycomyces algeriensis]GLI42167.1 hypothetical protein GALLR39Z86_20170 [Glycomyces algeriensis]